MYHQCADATGLADLQAKVRSLRIRLNLVSFSASFATSAILVHLLRHA